MAINLDDLLKEAVAKGASDIHLKVGVPAYTRIHGALVPHTPAPLTKADLDAIVSKLMEGTLNPKDRERCEVDVAYTLAGVSRFRCNIFRQRGTPEIVMRTVPYKIPSVDDLGLPNILNHLSLESRGLILVTGITGSGKSTTIAAMVNNINKSVPVHIVTIEDPIEFVYRDEMASITQREVGIDTESFHDALKYVLRQDPDVILLGEMRDRETAATAMTAAETGHLVLSTLHTADAIQTIDRIVDMFPPEQHNQIRSQLATSLKASISMRLVPKIGGGGMVAAIEIMINTPAIRSLIAENKLSEIKQLISEGASQYGMMTFDQSLLALFKSNLISKESALEEASSPAELELAMRGITVGTSSAQSFMKGSGQDYYKEQARENFKHANKLYGQGLLEEAQRKNKKSLLDWPDYPEALALAKKIEEKMNMQNVRIQSTPAIKLALDLIQQERFEDALAQINNALASDAGNEKLISLQKGTLERMEVVKNIKPMVEKGNTLMREGKNAEARETFHEVIKLDQYNNEAFARLSELFLANSRQVALAELEQVNKMAEEASGQKRWFDAALLWSMVREIHPDNQKAVEKLSEAGTQLKITGLTGLSSHAQDQWAPSVKSSYEKGIGYLLNGQAAACAGEWRQAAQKVPESASMFEPVMTRIKDLNAYHAGYHADRAKQLFERLETGRAMWHVKHGLQVEPQSAELRSIYDANSANAEKMVVDKLTEAENLLAGDHLRQALFCLERAFDIDPGREGLKQKLNDIKARVEKTGEIFAAMDKGSR